MIQRSNRVTTRRGQNLDDSAIAKIVSLVDGLQGKVTYDCVIAEIKLHLKQQYTRQALSRHERIRLAIETKRKIFDTGSGKSKPMSPTQKMQAEVLARLKSENARLQAENEALLQQFVRWAYNACMRGLDEAYLNQPLPTINRGRSLKNSK